MSDPWTHVRVKASTLARLKAVIEGWLALEDRDGSPPVPASKCPVPTHCGLNLNDVVVHLLDLRDRKKTRSKESAKRRRREPPAGS